MILRWLNRYRHGKGFGIHSPFAYRFITEVLEERLPYYDYSVIKDSRQRLVYRIACRFQPARVCSYGDTAPDAMTMACPGAIVSSDSPEMITARGEYDITPLLDAVARGCIVVVYGRKPKALTQIKDCLDGLGYGMTFDNERNTAIIVPNPKLPRQDFSVRF